MKIKFMIRHKIMLVFTAFLLLHIFGVSEMNVLAAETVLADSTRAGLQTAIDNAGSTPTSIIVSENFSFDGTAIVVPEESNITIRSNASVTLTQTDERHFTVNGSLTLKDIILSGSADETTFDTTGGVSLNGSGRLTMNEGAVIQNCFHSESGGAVMIGPSCVFTMKGGMITGNSTAEYGGGVHVMGDRDGGVSNTNGKFIMSGGVISGNKSTGSGGGVEVEGIVEMSGGTISNNTANSNGEPGNGGGGIWLDGAKATLSGDSTISRNIGYSGGGVGVHPGWETNERAILIILDNAKITDNTATEFGGGIYALADVIMQGGVISGNISSGSLLGGGGILVAKSIQVADGGTLEMTGGTISGNKSAADGGGIFAAASGSVKITGTQGICNITNNVAQGDGGGIFTRDLTYKNITTGSNTNFTGNKASNAYRPPDGALELYPEIKFSSVSIESHPLNNYDINFKNNEPIMYHITYHANGGEGSYEGTDIMPGGKDTVLTLEETGISRTDYTFIRWNTAANGTGNSYIAGDAITLNNDITLYAQWEEMNQPEPDGSSEPSSPTNPGGPSNPGSENPKTGDSGMVSWVYMLLGLFTTMAFLFLFKKRNKIQ